jgi:hypothetical protein
MTGRRVAGKLVMDIRNLSPQPRYAVILAHHYDGGHTVVVRCPYCGRRHAHGLPDRATSLDSRHRLSDCVVKHPDDHGYYLVEASEVSTGAPSGRPADAVASLAERRGQHDNRGA